MHKPSTAETLAYPTKNTGDKNKQWKQESVALQTTIDFKLEEVEPQLSYPREKFNSLN